MFGLSGLGALGSSFYIWFLFMSSYSYFWWSEKARQGKARTVIYWEKKQKEAKQIIFLIWSFIGSFGLFIWVYFVHLVVYFHILISDDLRKQDKAGQEQWFIGKRRRRKQNRFNLIIFALFGSLLVRLFGLFHSSFGFISFIW